jgi:uncharacterized protein involved in type VI secretion and phage assembly
MDVRTVRIVAIALERVLFKIRSVRCLEEPNRLYRVELELTLGSPGGHQELERSLWMSPATVIFDETNTAPARIHGVIAAFSHVLNAHVHGASVHLTIVPRVSVMTGRRSHPAEVFTGLTVREILTRMLEAAGFQEGLDFRFELRAEHRQPGPVVQHAQNDFDFMVQLCKSQGIFFFFEQDEARDVLIISDEAEAAFPQL